MIRIPYPPFLTVERELAGNTTPTDPRSQRIRASRKGRPCNELGLAAQGLSAACPHLCAPDAPCPRWAHHNPLSEESSRHQGAEIIMPDNGICERFHRTILDEFYRVAFRKKIYRSIDELQTDLDAWITGYNQQRPHQGRWCFGRPRCRPFLTRYHWQRKNSWPHNHARQPYRLTQPTPSVRSSLS